MGTLNVVIGVAGNLLVVCAFVWFICRKDKKQLIGHRSLLPVATNNIVL